MSEPINIRPDRILPATALFNLPIENFLGGLISILLRLIHFTVTPKLSIISTSRLTSSIRAIPCKTVLFLFNKEAHKRTTEPFFEKLVSMLPDNFFPPLISKSIDSIFLNFLDIKKYYDISKNHNKTLNGHVAEYFDSLLYRGMS